MGEVIHDTLRAANKARAQEWHGGQQIDLSFRGNELAGETGEACNIIKKLERERLGLRGSRATREQLANELADVVICADLVAMQCGIDLDAAVRRKFNITSNNVGLQTRMRELPMNIYIAGKVTARQRLRVEREIVRALGHICHSTWIDVAADYPPDYATNDTGVPSSEAMRDLQEITGAHLLIIDTFDESTTGGREFEAGYAHARGIPFWRVGPRRQVFHDLAEQRFATWNDVTAALRNWRVA